MVGVCMATTLIVVTGVLCMWSELVWAVLCVMVNLLYRRRCVSRACMYLVCLSKAQGVGIRRCIH